LAQAFKQDALITHSTPIVAMAPKADAKSKPKPKKEAAKEPKKEKKEEVDESGAPRVEEPDKKAFEEKQRAIRDKMDTLQKQLKGLSNKIGEKSHGRDDFQQKKSKLLEALTKEGSAIAELKSAKDNIMESLKSANQQAKDAKMDLKKMKSEVKFTTTADIDEKIKQLDFKLVTESLTLQTEKKILEEIKQLKKNKPLVKQVNAKEQMVNEMASVDSSSTMKEKLDIIKKEMDDHFTRKKELSAQLDQLKLEREAQTGDVKGLYDERDGYNNENRALKKELDDLNEEFYQKQKAFRDYIREVREQKWQQQQAEIDERKKWKNQEDRKRRVEKLDEMPHQHEITLLEQTIKFCKTFQPKEVAGQEEKKATSYDNPDTHVVLKTKGERDEEFYWAPTVGKKGKKAKKAGEGASSKAIKHNAETFKLFTSLKMDCPVTTEDIPKTLEKLQEELDSYLQKIKKWEEEKEERKKKILQGGDEDEEATEDKADAAEEKQE